MSGGPNQRGRGFRGSPRGGTGGRGPYRGGRGRGRGSFNRGRGGYHTLNEMDETFLMAESNFYSGTASPRGRGGPKPSGQYSSPNSGYNSGTGTLNRGRGAPRGRGRGGFDDYQSPRGRGRGLGDQSPRGRGQGRGGSKLRPDAPLSGLLYQERPLLRPVIFVPSVYTKKLFEEEEDIFQPVVEDVGEDQASHVPTADQVSRVFSARDIPRDESSSDENDRDEDEVEEIDFSDMAKLLETPTRPTSKLSTEVEVVEERFSGFYIDVDPYQVPKESAPVSSSRVEIRDTVVDEPSAYPATEPTPEPIAVTEECRLSLEDKSPIAPMQRNEIETQAAVPILPSAESDLPMHDAPAIFVDDAKIRETDIAMETTTTTEEFTGFYIDTEPSRVDSPHKASALPEAILDDDDEIIVYVAPHPRTGRITPVPPPPSTETPSLPSTSILTGTSTTFLKSADTNTAIKSPVSASTPTSTTPLPLAPSFTSVAFAFSPSPRKLRQQVPVFSAGSRSKAKIKVRRQEAHAARKRAEKRAVFGSFGAMREEAELRGGRDPRWEERRRGDSDVDWGDDADAGGGDAYGNGNEEASASGNGNGLAEGMDLDPDLELDENAMRRFVHGMGQEGGRFLTMDDIADREMMRMEDEEAEDAKDIGSSGDEEDEVTDDEAEADAVIHAEEEILISEMVDFGGLNDEESDEDDSDEEEDSPRASFQARLERLRNQASRKRPKDVSKHVASEDESDDDFDPMEDLSWADQDEAFLEHIEMILKDNEAIMTGRDRKARDQLFRAVRDGYFNDIEEFKPARKTKDRYKDLPPELQEQWQKDRDRKAENKRARALARLELSADPFSHKKGGKKGRKAMLAAAKLDPTINIIPNRIIDMTTLVQQIRRFLQDVGGPQIMSLPPTNKETRKNIHEMALAFNLKSVSKGKGDARYTTLTKTTRSGLYIDEKKVTRILRRSGGRGGGEFMGSNTRGDRGGKVVVARHKEGDEIGKAAPRIGEANVGFRMLALMGWSEGDRIGVSGGLEVPLTAVIKNTKLGLGATK